MSRVLPVALLTMLSSLLLAACGAGSTSDDAASGSASRTVDVKITDAGCEPAKLELPAGPTTFSVRNDGADVVTEFEVLGATPEQAASQERAPQLARAIAQMGPSPRCRADVGDVPEMRHVVALDALVVQGDVWTIPAVSGARPA